MRVASHRFEELQARAGALINDLERLGIRVHPASRLHEYLRALSSAVLYQTQCLPTSKELSVLNRLYLEVEDFETIRKYLGMEPEVDGWQRHVQRALDGSTLKEADVNDSARNTQFELIVAALFRDAGFDVKLVEPDLCVRDAEGDFAVAIKRVRSNTKIVTRIKEGEDQIVRSGRRGILALDLSSVINPSDAPADKTRAQQALRENSSYFRENIKRLRQQLRMDQVFGILFHDARLLRGVQDLTFSYQRNWFITNTLPLSDRWTQRLQGLETRLLQSSSGLLTPMAG